MQPNNMFGSQSSPSLLSNHATTNLRGSQLQREVSIENLHHNFINLNPNVEQIQQVDSCLQNGIHDARQKLIRTLRTEPEVQIGVVPIYHQIINANHMNETIRRNNVSWTTTIQQPITVTRTSRFDYKQREEQKIDGLPINPFQNKPSVVRQNQNVQSQQRMEKVGEDVFELKKIIQQRNQKIQFLEQELYQLNLRLSQERNRPISIKAKCLDCDRHIAVIRQLQQRIAVLNEKLAGQDINRLVSQLKLAHNESQFLKTKIMEVEKDKKIEIQKLTSIIEKMKIKGIGITNQTNINEQNQIITLRREIQQLKITIQKQQLSIGQKNFRIREIEKQLLNSRGQVRSMSKQKECENCIKIWAEFQNYKNSYNQQFSSVSQQLERANEKLYQFQQRDTEYRSLLKAAQQTEEENQRYKLESEKYIHEIQIKEQTIVELNEAINSLSQDIKGKTEIISSFQTQIKEMMSEQKANFANQKDSNLTQWERDAQQKIQELESHNSMLQNELVEEKRSKENLKRQNESLVQELQVFMEEKRHMINELKNIQSRQESTAQIEFKGYYYSSKLQQLQALLSKLDYAELNIKINKLLNFKNTTIKQLLGRKTSQTENILEFGTVCYALDEIMQRILEALQHNSRAFERIKAERDALNQYSAQAEQSMRKSGTLSQQAKQENRRLQSTLSIKQFEITQLKQKVRSFERQINTKNEKFLTTNLQLKEKQIKELREAFAKFEKEINRKLEKSQSTLVTKDNQIRNLQQQIQILNDEASQKISIAAEKKEKQINLLKQQLVSLEIQANRKIQSQGVLKNEISYLTDKLRTFERQTHLKLENSFALENQIVQLKQRLQSLEQQANTKLQNMLRAKNQETSYLEESLQDIQKETALKFESKLGLKDKELNQMKERVRNVEKQITVRFQNDLRSKDQEMRELKQRYQSFEQEISRQWEKQFIKRDNEITHLNQRLKSSERDISSGFESILQGKDNQISQLKQRLKNIEGQMGRKADSESALRNQISQLNEKLRNYDRQSNIKGQDTQNSKQTLSFSQKQTNQLKQALSMTEKEVIQLKQLLSKAQQESSQLKLSLNNSEREALLSLKLKENEIRQLHEKLKIKQKEAAEAESWKSKYTKIQQNENKLNELERKLAETQREMQSREAKFQEQRKQIRNQIINQTVSQPNRTNLSQFRELQLQLESKQKELINERNQNTRARQNWQQQKYQMEQNYNQTKRQLSQSQNKITLLSVNITRFQNELQQLKLEKQSQSQHPTIINRHQQYKQQTYQTPQLHIEDLQLRNRHLNEGFRQLQEEREILERERTALRQSIEDELNEGRQLIISQLTELKNERERINLEVVEFKKNEQRLMQQYEQLNIRMEQLANEEAEFNQRLNTLKQEINTLENRRNHLINEKEAFSREKAEIQDLKQSYKREYERMLEIEKQKGAEIRRDFEIKIKEYDRQIERQANTINEQDKQLNLCKAEQNRLANQIHTLSQQVPQVSLPELSIQPDKTSDGFSQKAISENRELQNIQLLKQTIRHLSQQNGELVEQLRKYEGQSSKIDKIIMSGLSESDAKVIIEERNALHQNLVAAENYIEQLIKEKEEEKIKMDEYVTQIESRANMNQEKIRKLELENMQLKESKSSIKMNTKQEQKTIEKKSNIEQELEKFRRELKQQKQKTRKLQAEIEAVSRSKSDQHNLSRLLEEEMAKIEAVRSSKINVNSQLQSYKQKYTKLEKQLSTLKSTSQSQNLAVKQTLEQLSAEKINLSSSLSMAQSYIAQLENQITVYKSRIVTQVSSISNPPANIKSEINNQNELSQALIGAENQIERLRMQNTSLNSQSLKVSQELERLRKVYEDLQLQNKKQIENFQTQIRRIVQQHENKLTDLEGKKSALIQQMTSRRQTDLKELESKHNQIINTFKTTINALEKEIKNLNQKLQNEQFKKNNEIRVLQTENATLVERVKQLQTTILIHSSQQLKLDSLEEENAKILEQLKFLTQELQRLNNELQRLSAELRQATSVYESQKNKLSNELESTRMKKEEIYENLLRAQNYIGKCEQQIQQLKKLLQEQANKVKELMAKQIINSQVKNQSLENQRILSQLREALTKTEAEKNQLVVQVKNLKEQIQDLQRKLEDTERINLQKSQIQSERNIDKQKLQKTEEERIRLTGQNELYRQQISKLEAEAKAIQARKYEIQRLQQQFSSSKSELTQKENDIRKLNDQSSQLKYNINLLEKQLKNLNNLEEKSKAIEEQNRQLQQQVTKLKSKVASLQQKSHHHEDKEKRLKSEKKQLATEVDKLSNSLEEERKEKKETHNQLNLAENEIEKLMGYMQILENEKMKVHSKEEIILQLNQQKTQLEAEKNVEKQKSQKSEEERIKLNIQVDLFKQRIEQLEGETKSVEVNKYEIQRLQQQLNFSKSGLTTKQNEIRKLSEQSSQLRNHINALEKQLRNLDILEEKSRTSEEHNKKLQQQLTELRNKIDLIQQSNRKHEDKESRLESESRDFAVSINKLNANLETQMKEKNEAQNQLKLAEDEIEKLMGYVKILEDEKVKDEHTINELRDSVRNTQQIAQLKQKQYQLSIQNLKEQIEGEARQAEISNFEKLLENMTKAQTHIHFIECQLSRLQNENNSLQQSNNSLSEDLRVLKDQKQSLEKLRNQLEQNLRNVQKESVNDLNLQVERNRNLEKELTIYKLENENLVVKVADYERRLANLENTLIQQSEQNRNREDSISQQTVEINNLKAQLNEKDRILEEQQKNKSRLQNEITQLRQVKIELIKLKEQATRIPNLQNQIQQLVNQNKGLREVQLERESVINKATIDNKVLQQEKQRNEREIENLNTRLGRNQEILQSLRKQLESKDAHTLAIISEKQKQVDQLYGERQHLIQSSNQANSNLQKLETEFNNAKNISTSLSQQNNELKLQNNHIKADHQKLIREFNELKAIYENLRQEADHYRFKFNEADSYIKHLELTIQDLKKNILRLNELENNLLDVFAKIEQIEAALQDLLPQQLREKNKRLFSEFDGMVEQFNKKIQEQKQKAYEAFIKEFPYKKDEVRRAMTETVHKQDYGTGEKDLNVIDDLSQKLVSIERDKKNIMLDLQRMKLLREIQLKLEEAEENLRKKQLENLNLLREKDNILRDANALSLQIQGIKQQFAKVQSHAQQRMLVEIEATKSKYQSEINKLNKKLLDLQEEYGKNSSQKDKSSPIFELQNKGATPTKDAPNLSPTNIQTQVLKQKISGLENALFIKQEQEKQMVEKMKNLYGQLEEVQKRTLTLEQEHESLKKDCSQKNSKLESLQKIEAALNYAESYIFEKQTEINSLKEKISSLEKQLGETSLEIAQLYENINKLKQNIEELEKEVANKSKQIQQLKQQCRKLETERDNQIEAGKQLKQKQQALEARINVLQGQSATAAIELKEKNKELAFSKSKLETQIHLLEESFKEIEIQLSHKNTLLDNNIKQLEEQQVLRSQIEREKQNLLKEVQNKDQKLVQSEKELNNMKLQLEEDNNKLRQKIKDLENEMNTILGENSNLSVAMNFLAKQAEDLRKGNIQIAQLNQNLLQKEIALNEKQNKITQLKSVLNSLEMELQQNKSQCDEKDKQMNKMMIEIANLRDVGKKNEGQLSQMIGNLKKQLGKLQDQRQKQERELQDEIVRLRGHITNIANEKQEMEGRIKEIERNHQELAQKYEQLNDAIERLAEGEELAKVSSLINTPIKKTIAIETSDKKVGGSNKSHSSAQKDPERVRENIDRISNLLSSSNQKIQELLAYNNSLVNQLKQYEVKTGDLLKELEDKEREEDEQRQKELGELTKKSEYITSITAQIEYLKGENNRLLKQLQKTTAINSELQDQLNKKSVKEAELIQENENIIKNVQLVEEHLVKTEQNFKEEKKQKAQEINALKNQLKQKEEALKSLQNEIQNLQSGTTNVNTQYSNLLEKFNKLNEEMEGKDKKQQQSEEEHKKTIENMTIQLKQKQSQIQFLTTDNQKYSQQVKDYERKLTQANNTHKKQTEAIQQRYEQLMAELIEYETLNKKLTEEVQRLSDQINLYKSKVEQFSKQAMDSSNELNSSSVENQELKKRLENAESEISKLKQKESEIQNESENQILVEDESKQKENRDIFIQFLRQSLRKISTLEQNVNNLQSELNQNSAKLQKIIDSYSQDSQQIKSSQLRLQLNQLNQLQYNLIQNEKQINESCENVDNAIKDIREMLNQPQNQIDKEKLNVLFDQLEKNVKESQKLHEQQLLNMALVIKEGQQSERFRSEEGDSSRRPRMEEEESIGYKTERLTISNKAQLIKQVKELRNMINIYHKQAQRRKKVHLKTVSKLQIQITKLKQIYGQMLTERKEQVQSGSSTEKLMLKIGELSSLLDLEVQKAKKKEEEQRQSSGFDFTDQEILAGHGQGTENQLIQSLRQSLNENSRQIDFSQIVNQSNFDARAFLDYIFQTHEFEREEILELKRKIVTLRSRQTCNNMDYLQNRKKEVESLLQDNKQKLPLNVGYERFLQAVADHTQPEQIQQIFIPERNNELMNKIADALRNQESGDRSKQMHTEDLIEQIRQIMEKYYQQSNNLSNALYQFILMMLASPSDDVLLGIVDNMFATILKIEEFYSKVIEEKDKVIEQHNEMMQKLLNRSSSGDSQQIKNMMDEYENEQEREDSDKSQGFP